jgi:hypothetical protein
VLDRPAGVAFAQAEGDLEAQVHLDERLPGPQLGFLERGGDLLPGLPAAGGAQGGDQRHVQPPGRALAEGLVVAGGAEPGRLGQDRAPSFHRGEQVPVVLDDLPDDLEGHGVEDAAGAEPASGPGQVGQQVVDVVVLVGPHPVHRAARHPGPLDDLFQPQVLDGQRGAGLQREFAPRVEHPLPDFLRWHPLGTLRHGRQLLVYFDKNYFFGK